MNRPLFTPTLHHTQDFKLLLPLRLLITSPSTSPCSSTASRQRGGQQPKMILPTTTIPPPTARVLEVAQRSAMSALLGLSLALSPGLSGLPLPALAATDSTTGFEEFAATGGTMKADPNCFFSECGVQTKACFSNPACLKGITCLGNCRGEQLCATQCFARFGS